MKKLALVISCAVLVSALAACVAPGTVVQEPSPDPTATATSTPKTSAPPTNTSPSAPLGDFGGLVPEVKPGAISLDPAAYEARLNAMGKYSPEPDIAKTGKSATIDNLIPGNYGTLYPFIGAYMMASEGGFYDQPIPKYGLCNASGEIIVSPDYVRIYPLYSGPGYWSANRGTPVAFVLVEIVGEQKSGESGQFIQSVYKNSIISANGAWKAGPYSEVLSAGEGYMFILRDNKWGVLDPNGRESVPCKFEQGGDLDDYPNSIYEWAENGIAFISYPDNGPNKGKCFIINRQGDMFEGPYIMAYPNSAKDVFTVTTTDLKTGLMRTDGTWVIEPMEADLTLLGNGFVCVTPKSEGEVGNTFGIMDYSGKYVVEQGERTIRVFEDSIFVSDLEYEAALPLSDKTGTFYDNDMNVIHPPENFGMLDHFYGTDFYKWETKDGIVIADFDGDRAHAISTDSNYYRVFENLFVIDGKLVDMDTGNEIIDLDGKGGVNYLGKDSILVYGAESNACILYDLEGKQVLSGKFRDISMLDDGIYRVSQNKYEGIINRKGEWILRINTLKYLED